MPTFVFIKSNNKVSYKFICTAYYENVPVPVCYKLDIEPNRPTVPCIILSGWRAHRRQRGQAQGDGGIQQIGTAINKSTYKIQPLQVQLILIPLLF